MSEDVFGPSIGPGSSGSSASNVSPSGDTTGATDYASIQRYLNGGGLAALSSGTYTVNQPLILYTNSLLKGAGIDQTVITLASGANCNVVQSQNFTTLVGTDNTSTPHNFGWQDLTIDGNASGQTALTTSSTASITASTATVTDSSNPFTAAMVGQPYRLAGAGPGGSALVASILTYTSASQITLSVNASTTVTNGGAKWGWGIGVASYGNAIAARNYRIRNCLSWGLWTEWATQSTWISPDGMDSKMTEFMLHDNGEGGWYCAGPHDIQCTQFHIVRNGPGAGSGTAQLYTAIANKANGATFDLGHIWGGTSDYCARVSASGITFGKHMQMEGGRVAQLAYENGSNYVHGRLFAGGVNASTVKGIVFLGGTPGAISGDVTIEDCGGACVDFTNAGGNHNLTIRGRYSGTSAPTTPVVGSPSNSQIDYFVTNNDFTIKARSQRPSTLWQPSDQGLLTWAYDPIACTAGDVLATAGTVYVTRMHLQDDELVTNIILYVATAGVTLTSGQCFAALYQGAGTAATLLGTTADQSSAWASTGVKTMAISGGPVSALQGEVCVVFWANGTTLPAFGRGGEQQTLLNMNSNRFMTADTGKTTTAPSPLGTVSQSFHSYWAGLS